MATIIDSLLVTLGIDSKDFDAKRSKVDKGLKSTKDEADKTGKSLNKAGKDGAAGFDSAAKSALAFFAILGGTSVVKNFIENTISSSAALNRFSINLSTNTSDIVAWGNAAKIAGGTADEFRNTIAMFSREQTNLLLTGESSLIPYLTALGVGMADNTGRAIKFDEWLLNLADSTSKLNRTTAFNMLKQMGIDEGTINLILQGRKEVELMIRRQKEYGDVMAKFAPIAAKVQKQLDQMELDFIKFGTELLTRAMPTLEKLINTFDKFGEWCVANKAQITDFLSAITVMLVGLGLALTPINATTAAIVGLGTALALVYEDYKTWQAGGDSLIPWAKWVPYIHAAGYALTWLRDLAADAFYRIFAAADAAHAAVTGDWGHAKWALGQVVEGNGSTYGATDTAAPAAASAKPSGGKALPRGVRNNNPGNLNFAGQAGATKEGGANGRFAVFGSMRQGVAALVKQIGLYVGRGKNTIRKIIETYAPAFENNTQAYIAAVSKAVGLGSDEPLDINNANQVMALVRAITDHENGKGFVSDTDIAGGFNMAKLSGIPGASRAAGGASASKVAKGGSGGAVVTGGSSSVDTTIGQIVINTQATDADGIAKDMGKSLNYLFTSQANVGMN